MKSGEEPAEKVEFFGEKLRRVGKRGGHTTPLASFWRLEESEKFQDFGDNISFSNFRQNPSQIPCVSARKLAATLWELHHYKGQLRKMHNGGGAPLPRLRRLNHGQVYKDKTALEPLDPSPASLDLVIC